MPSRTCLDVWEESSSPASFFSEWQENMLYFRTNWRDGLRNHHLANLELKTQLVPGGKKKTNCVKGIH